MAKQDAYGIRSTLEVGGKTYVYYRLQGLEEQGLGSIGKLPFSIKVLLEAAVRQFDGHAITKDHVKLLAGWAEGRQDKEIPFIPAASCCRTSPACRSSSTSRRCATR